MSERMRLHQARGGVWLLTCFGCGHSSRLQADEPFMGQLRLFLKKHGHERARVLAADVERV